jgi:ribonuclease Z
MNFSLKILGSSSAMPTPERYSTAQVLNVLERFFLIDCGEGTQIQMRRFKIKYTKINHVFISHLHGDHFLGLFGFISTMNLQGRNTDLHIYAPFKLEALLQAFINTMDHGLNYEIIFHPHEYNGTKTIYEDKKVEVTSFPLRHRIPTVGFLFKEKPSLRNLKKNVVEELNIPISKIQGIKEGEDFINEEGAVFPNKNLTIPPPHPRSYAFASDTAYMPKLSEIVNEVDLLYHEATYTNTDKKLAKATGHSTAEQAAQIAKNANAKKLLLGHFSNRYKNKMDFLCEAEKIFPPTILAKDGLSIDIPVKR